MPRLHAEIWAGREELAARTDAWNELWQHSPQSGPLAQAAPCVDWLARYAPRSPLRTVVVWEGERLVAALPLLGRTVHRVLPAAGLPADAWSPCGDLLLHEQADRAAVCLALAEQLPRLPWPVLWLDEVRLSASRWQALLAALPAAGLPFRVEPQLAIGQFDVAGEWEAYRRRWTRNHRHAMQKILNRAEREGGYELFVVSGDDPTFADWLARCWELEHRGWKGREGSSVLACGRAETYAAQAAALQPEGVLLALLLCQGELAAFEFTLAGHGTLYPLKIGYDESLARVSPGQLLRLFWYERLFAEQRYQSVDFIGPLVEATAKWSTRSETLGRLIVGAWPRLGGLLLRGYDRLRARRDARRCREEPPAPGVAPADESAEPVAH